MQEILKIIPSINHVVREKAASQMIGVSQSTFKRLVKKGLIKKPIQISPRSIGYLVTDIQDYINQRIAERDNDQ